MLAPGVDSVGSAVKDVFIAGAYDAPLPPSGDTTVGAAPEIAGAYDAPLPPSGVIRALPYGMEPAIGAAASGSAGILPASISRSPKTAGVPAGRTPAGSAVILTLPCRTIAAAPNDAEP